MKQETKAGARIAGAASRKFLTPIIVLSILGAVYALTLHPSWSTASSAEIDRVIDPVLLQKEPSDPAAEARYDRLVKLIDQLPSPVATQKLDGPIPGTPTYVAPKGGSPFGRSSKEELSSDFRVKAKTILPQIEKILEEGEFRVRPHDDKSSGMQYTEASKIRNGLSLLILDSGTPVADRIAAVRIGLLYSRRNFDASRSLINVLSACAVSSKVERATTSFLLEEKLSASNARELLATFPDIGEATQLKRSIVGEFQEFVYKFLPDPAAYLGKREPPPATQFDEDADDTGEFGDEIYDYPGNYNAIDSAKEASGIAMEMMRNSEAKIGAFSTPLGDRASKVIASLPEMDHTAKPGLKRWWNRETYRFKMRRIPNSFFYLNNPYIGIQDLVIARDNARAKHELLRIQLACLVYKGEKGRWPTALSELVSQKLLASVPLDPFDGKPLRYDADRKILWSIGRDAVDDGGSEKRNGSRTADEVVHLVQVPVLSATGGIEERD